MIAVSETNVRILIAVAISNFMPTISDIPWRTQLRRWMRDEVASDRPFRTADANSARTFNPARNVVGTT